MNPEPLTVTVVLAELAGALEGETDATLGVGFGLAAGGLLVEPPATPPPQEDNRKVDRRKATEKAKTSTGRRRAAERIKVGPRFDSGTTGNRTKV